MYITNQEFEEYLQEMVDKGINPYNKSDRPVLPESDNITQGMCLTIVKHNVTLNGLEIGSMSIESEKE